MENTIWKQTNIQAFWQNVSTREHVVQIYENERVILDSLEGFAGTGFLSGNSVVIIASDEHINALDMRLRMHGFDLEQMRRTGEYVTRDVKSSLAAFLRNDLPDERLFMKFANDLLSQAKNHSLHVRAFGEMVSELMKLGNVEATKRLEELWSRVCEKENICLFCAYPEANFANGNHVHVEHICSLHTKRIGGWAKPSTEIFYLETGE